MKDPDVITLELLAALAYSAPQDDTKQGRIAKKAVQHVAEKLDATGEEVAKFMQEASEGHSGILYTSSGEVRIEENTIRVPGAMNLTASDLEHLHAKLLDYTPPKEG